MLLGVFKRYGFAAVVAVALGLMALVIVGKSVFSLFGADGAAAASGQAKGAKGPGGPGGGATGVLAVAAAQHTFTDGLQALGTAQARESIVLTPKVADTIRAIRFDIRQQPAVR